MHIILLLFYWMLLLNVSNLKFFIDRIRFWIIFYKIDVYLCCALRLSYRRLLHLRCALHLLKLCPSLKKKWKIQKAKECGRKEKHWNKKYCVDLKLWTIKIWSFIHVLKKPPRSADQDVQFIYMFFLHANIFAATN